MSGRPAVIQPSGIRTNVTETSKVRREKKGRGSVHTLSTHPTHPRSRGFSGWQPKLEPTYFVIFCSSDKTVTILFIKFPVLGKNERGFDRKRTQEEDFYFIVS